MAELATFATLEEKGGKRETLQFGEPPSRRDGRDSPDELQCSSQRGREGDGEASA